MRTCPQCGGRIGTSKTEQSHDVAGHRFLVKSPALVCRRCRTTFMTGPALEQALLEIACLLAMRASPSGEALRFMRKVLGIRAGALATLLSVTAETVSRWENDQRAMDANAWIAVGSILLEHAGRPPKTYERLAALHDGHKLPKNVKIDLTPRPTASRPRAGLRRSAAG